MKMSREIKFRGFLKDIDVIGIGVPHTGHFVIGDLVQGTEYEWHYLEALACGCSLILVNVCLAH